MQVERGGAWTSVKVRVLRERLHVPEFDEHAPRVKSISVDETANQRFLFLGLPVFVWVLFEDEAAGSPIKRAIAGVAGS